MDIVPNHTKRQLASGGLALGMGVRNSRTVDIATVARTCDFDWLFIDMEHSSLDVDLASQLAMASLGAMQEALAAFQATSTDGLYEQVIGSLQQATHEAIQAMQLGADPGMTEQLGQMLVGGTMDEIVAAMKAVRHANFKIWYDAGNIIYYAAKDPVEELKPIAQHVTGFCAKDCGALKGDVMIQFGTGKVDFAAVFATLKTAGFDGPLMVECCKVGATAEETMANARANRMFLERVLAQV